MNHAQQRAAERYGLDLSQDDLSAIRLAIGQGRALIAIWGKGYVLRVSKVQR